MRPRPIIFSLDLTLVRTTAEPSEMPGADRTLRALRDHGHALFLSTGASAAVLAAALERHGWEDLFTLALGSESDGAEDITHLMRFAAADGDSFGLWVRRGVTVGCRAQEMRLGLRAGVRLRCAYVPDADASLTDLSVGGANLFVRHLDQIVQLAEHPDPLRARQYRPSF